MERLLIKDTLKKIGENVLISGWVNTVRDHGKITFLDLRDRSGLVQCVGNIVDKVAPEYVVEIVGKVVKRPEKLINKNIETGGVEVQIEKLNILSISDELPFDMGVDTLNLQLPTLLDYRTLTLRHSRVKKIFKVQEAIMEGFRKAAQDLGCTEIFVPTISASSTEGGAEVFKVDYYGRPAFMIQSPQLYKQMLVPAFERVYLVSHAYRAEPSVTTRHLSESIQMDCELGFVEFDELLDAIEFVGKNTIQNVSNKYPDILSEYGVDLPKFGKKIPRVTMREAQEIVKKRTGVDHTSEPDLMPEDEREICKWALEEFESDLVTVTHYPTKKRAFYTLPDPENPEFSLSYDLLFRGLEILSGSQRVNKYDDLVRVIKERGMDPENFKMYLQTFKYGMPPEGGFSFGLERMTMQILNLQNVREASLFPRDTERVDFTFSSRSVAEKKESGAINVFENLKNMLTKSEVDVEILEHTPVFSSEDSAKVRNTSLHQGAKALVLDSGNELLLYVLPADEKADLKDVGGKIGVDKLKMASEKDVLQKTSLRPGSIPPFGSVMGMKTYVKASLSENEEIAFNAGRNDISIKMKYEDFLKIENPTIL